MFVAYEADLQFTNAFTNSKNKFTKETKKQLTRQSWYGRYESLVNLTLPSCDLYNLNAGGDTLLAEL